MYMLGVGAIKVDGKPDTTNINGEYSLAVSPGRWEVGYDLPVNEDGSLLPYFVTPPKRLKIKESDGTRELDFFVKSAGATVTGVVYGPDGISVSDLNVWVYAREFTSDGDTYRDILAEVPLSSKGTFTFPGLPGEYLVGIWLPPGSDYGHAGEKYYKVEVENGTTTLKDNNDAVVSQASFTLSQNDSVVKGIFKLSGQPVTGLTGEVHAIRLDGDGWQSTAIEDDGSYEMVLSAGSWAIDYYIEADVLDRKIPKYPAEPLILKTNSSSTTEQDFALATATASIAGTAFTIPINLPLLTHLFMLGLFVKALEISRNIGMRLKPTKTDPSPYLFFVENMK